MAEKKRCEQCHVEKELDLFCKVTNQYTGVHSMSICKDCYKSNTEERSRRQAEEWEARKAAWEAARETERRTREEAHKRAGQAEQERLVHQQALEAWYQ